MKEEQIWGPSPPLLASVWAPVLVHSWDKKQHTYPTREGIPSQLKGSSSPRESPSPLFHPTIGDSA